MSSFQVGLSIVLGTLTLLGLLEARFKSLIKHYLSELKPNGGGSVKDQVSRLEKRVDDIYSILINKD